jgi:arabinose-5-phosphate isomerase
LLLVNEIMRKDDEVPIISQNAKLKEALVRMTEKKLGMTTIVNEAGELIGVFTDGDVRRAFDNNADIHQTQIIEVMSKNPKTISNDLLAAEALTIMETYKITSLVVIDHKTRPVGIIHIHDILRAGVI